MVSPDDVTIQTQLNVNYYTALIAFVILYYDHILTLPTEIQRFWTRGPFTWTTFFFFLNRYLAFLGHFPVILQEFWDPSDLDHKFTTSARISIRYLAILAYLENFSCRLIHSYHQYLVVAIQVAVGALLIMRVYAMYDRKKWVVWLFVVIATTEVAVGCWGILSNTPIAVSSSARSARGCSEPLGNEQAVHLAVAWSGQLVFDAICFFLTLRKSITIGRTDHRELIDTLLRDGAMYFAIMTAANLANILTFLLAAPLSRGVASTFVNIISVTMISRLMLNLRDPKMFMSISRRTTRATTTASSNPMVTTFLDPHLVPTTINEESEGEGTNPIEPIEMVPRTQHLDPEA